MVTYKFEASGSYVVITKITDGVAVLSAIPAGVYSILPHIANDGRLCLIGDLKTEAEQSLSPFNEEITLHYSEIESPFSPTLPDAIANLSAIFGGEVTAEVNVASGESATSFELTASSALNSINEQLEEIKYFIKSIAE